MYGVDYLSRVLFFAAQMTQQIEEIIGRFNHRIGACIECLRQENHRTYRHYPNAF